MPSTYKRVTHIQCSPQAEMFAVSSGQENIKRGGTLSLWDFNRLQTIVCFTERVVRDHGQEIRELTFSEQTTF